MSQQANCCRQEWHYVHPKSCLELENLEYVIMTQRTRVRTFGVQKPELQKKIATGSTAWKHKETNITKLQGTRYH